MNKLMDNHWFLKGIALLLALMLYMSINLDKQPESSFTSSSFPVGNVTETVSDVEVVAYYEQEKYSVAGIPKHVTLTLEGPNNLIATTKLKRQFEVFVDLKGYGTGTYDVRLQYKDIPEKLKVKISPAKIKVNIAKKVTKSFPVELSFINGNQIKEGYNAEKASIKPAFVNIYGTEEQLSQIGAIKAYIDLKGVYQTVTKEARVAVYDKNGEPLNIQTIPQTVTVTVPIVSPEKKVPVKVTRKGTLQQGVTVTDIKVEPEEVVIYGAKDVLADIEALEGVSVDLDKITEDTSFDVLLPLPKGVTKVYPEKVKVIVKVQKEERKSISEIPIQPQGLKDTLSLAFLDPKSGKIDVDIIGEASVVNSLEPSSISASINVGNLSPGTHNVPVQINGPANVTLELKQKNVTVEITNKS
ncbi:MAG: YbbR-like domain-containing protein [Ectobacillus sp.]